MTEREENFTVLAFDVGTKRTGVAVGQTLTRQAQPAGQLQVKQGRFDAREIDRLIQTWQPTACVLGEPHGESAPLNKVINRLEHYLRAEHKLSVYRIDERLTSAAASAEMAGSGLTQQRKTELRDQIAACLILETWLNQPRS